MDTLTPNDLFSPSKARQQRAQAQDWAQIESWLTYKYAGRTIPTFERNEDTLKALRALSTANERADEERDLMERIEREALKEFDEIEQHPADIEILDKITSHLTSEGQQSLEALASTTVELDTPNTDPETIAHALIKHTVTAQTLTQHLHRLQSLQSYLQTQLSSLRSQLQELQSPAFNTPPSLSRQTNDWTRQTKLLRSKLREYEDRLSSLSVTPQNSRDRKAQLGTAEGLENLVEEENEVQNLENRVEELEADVKRYAGLPAEKEAARKEVRKLEVELDGVRRRRDGLFEGLVEK